MVLNSKCLTGQQQATYWDPLPSLLMPTHIWAPSGAGRMEVRFIRWVSSSSGRRPLLTHIPQGPTPVYSRSLTAPSYQYDPPAELQSQRYGPDCQRLLGNIDLRFHSVAGHNQRLPDTVVPPEAVREHPVRKFTIPLPIIFINVPSPAMRSSTNSRPWEV